MRRSRRCWWEPSGSIAEEEEEEAEGCRQQQSKCCSASRTTPVAGVAHIRLAAMDGQEAIPIVASYDKNIKK